MNEKHQDYIYIKENYIKKPKETFIFLSKLIKTKKHKVSLLDLGCAKGEFLFYIEKKFKGKIDLTGVDYSPKLIREAQEYNLKSKIKFIKNDAEKIKINKKFDYIVASGLVSYFDNIEIFLKNSIKHLKKNGKLIILDNFNKYDIDVIVRYRDNYNKFKNFEKGWNLHSIGTIKKIINPKKYKISFKKFNLSFKLKKRKDAMRSWQVNLDKKKMFMNGLSQIFEIEALIINKSS